MAARALAKVDAGRGYVCTGDCREANLRGWMQAQACYNARGCVDVPLSRPAHSEIRHTMAEVSPHASFMLLLPVDRVPGRQVGEWASGYPSVIRGSMAARSHNYAATMHISLPITAKLGLETFHEA